MENKYKNYFKLINLYEKKHLFNSYYLKLNDFKFFFEKYWKVLC